MTASWYNLSHDGRGSPKSVYAVSEEGILDGCTDIDHHSWAKVDEALVGSDRFVNSKVQRLIEGSRSAETSV